VPSPQDMQMHALFFSLPLYTFLPLSTLFSLGECVGKSEVRRPDTNILRAPIRVSPSEPKAARHCL
jgi:hypothetical protein